MAISRSRLPGTKDPHLLHVRSDRTDTLRDKVVRAQLCNRNFARHPDDDTRFVRLLALGLFALLSLCCWRGWWSRIGDGRGWLRLGVRLGAVGLALWLTALPVIHYGLNEPAVFWDRVRNTSLLSRRDEPDLVKAIVRNTLLHLLMFNVNGDRNRR